MMLGHMNIMCRCVSWHFLSVATSKNGCDVIDQTPLRPLYSQLAFLYLALGFLNLLLIGMNVMKFL
jgi:hypothetical protein